MRILITGGAGFIGTNTTRRAVGLGHEVHVLDDFSSGRASNLAGLDISVTQASILNPDALDHAMDGAEAVIHLAAIPSVPESIVDPVGCNETNVTGTLRVLEAARRHSVGSVVLASSAAIYGMNQEMPQRERAWVRPLSPYGVSKLAAEQYTLAYQDCFGLSTVAFRFFNIYGPWQRAGDAYAAVIPAFVERALAAQPLCIQGDGHQTRDFVYVETLADILLTAATESRSIPEPVNVAFGQSTSVLELLEELRAVFGELPEVTFGPAREGDIRHSRADSSVLRSEFPRITPVDLRTGLQATVAWARKHISC